MKIVQIIYCNLLLIFLIFNGIQGFRCYKCNYLVDAERCYDPAGQNAPTTVCQPKSSNHVAFCYSLYNDNKNKTGIVRGCKNDYEYGNVDDFCMNLQKEDPKVVDCEFGAEDLFNKKVFNGFHCYVCDSRKENCHKASQSFKELCFPDNPNHISYCFTTYSKKKEVIRGCSRNASSGGFGTICDRIRERDSDITDCQYCTEEFCNNKEYNRSNPVIHSNTLALIIGYLVIKLFI